MRASPVVLFVCRKIFLSPSRTWIFSGVKVRSPEPPNIVIGEERKIPQPAFLLIVRLERLCVSINPQLIPPRVISLAER